MSEIKTVVVEVEKGLILEINRDNNKQVYLKIRKAKDGEEQEEFDMHYAYNVGSFLRYFFEFIS